MAGLAQALGARAKRNELQSRHTTARIGGPADLYVEALTSEELGRFVLLAREHQAPYLVLGSGSNVLISEAGFRGLVIANRAKSFKIQNLRLYAGPLSTDYTVDTFVWAESGVALPSLARECIKQGYANLEWAVGVPGTVGGAVVGNAGAHGGDVARDLICATILDDEGAERNWSNEELGFGYRTSKFKIAHSPGLPSGAGKLQMARPVILAASLSLRRSTPEELEARAAEYTERRKRTQPAGATLGSMFKNPPGDFAGRLIEAAGLKGARSGNAQISPVHANFFINLGGASAADMGALIDLAREKVRAQFGIEMELEIELIGEG